MKRFNLLLRLFAVIAVVLTLQCSKATAQSFLFPVNKASASQTDKRMTSFVFDMDTLSKSLFINPLKPIADTLFFKCKLVYSAVPDSFPYYYNLALPLQLAVENMDGYFRMRAWNIYWLIDHDYRDKGFAEILQVKHLAEQYHWKSGVYGAIQCLGHFYRSIGLDKEAARIWEDLYDTMVKENASSSEKINIIFQLLPGNLSLAKRAYYLSELKKFTDYLKENHLQAYDDNNTLPRLCYSYFRRKAFYDNERKDWATMKLDIDSATFYMYKKEYYYSIQYIKMSYCVGLKRYSDALALNDSVLTAMKNKSAIDYISVLNDRCKILKDCGRPDEAYDIYYSMMLKSDTISSDKYFKDLATYRSRMDLNKLDIENQEMRLSVAQRHKYITALTWGGISLTLFVLFLLLFFWKRYSDSQRIKKQMQRKVSYMSELNLEIRTPMNVIDGFSNLIMNESDPHERRKYSDIIHYNNELLQRMIKDALDLTKIQSNQLTLNYSMCDLQGIMRAVFETVNNKVPENIVFELADSPKMSFPVDSLRLKQALVNLIEVAISRTKVGVIRFGYSASDRDCRFFVYDSGIEISAERIHSLFDHPFQSDEWTSNDLIGFAIFQGLIEQMRGKVDVSPDIHGGTELYFILPRKKI